MNLGIGVTCVRSCGNFGVGSSANYVAAWIPAIYVIVDILLVLIPGIEVNVGRAYTPQVLTLVM